MVLPPRASCREVGLSFLHYDKLDQAIHSITFGSISIVADAQSRQPCLLRFFKLALRKMQAVVNKVCVFSLIGLTTAMTLVPDSVSVSRILNVFLYLPIIFSSMMDVGSHRPLLGLSSHDPRPKGERAIPTPKSLVYTETGLEDAATLTATLQNSVSILICHSFLG